ncbi:hypothetical protein [Methanoregula sp.]|uniref:hypothetical protein n=1 Tax=Methanoregula sp. TaxID=2052170 RepID=UPI003C19F270
MSPRHEHKPLPRDPPSHAGSHPSPDKERQIEDAGHHPMAHPLPHPAHHPVPKPALPPRHDAHSHPHGDELPAHTNPPGPIRPSKKLTKTGKI